MQLSQALAESSCVQMCTRVHEIVHSEVAEVRNSSSGSSMAASHVRARKPRHQYLETNACSSSGRRES